MANFHLRKAEYHRDAAWEVHQTCDNYRHDTGPKGFHDSLSCGYCNRASQYHIDNRNFHYKKYDKLMDRIEGKT